MSPARSRAPASARNSFRIVGGSLRGRRVHFPPVAAVRPTPDRVRETLFNWLAAIIHDARCLDLFTGSGALGLEAASRGAGRVVLVDRDRRLAGALQSRIAELALDERATCLRADALDYLAQSGEDFDVVFLDPPFGQGWLARVLNRLPPRLAPGNRVYVESESALALELPAGWQSLREGRAGAVAYRLLNYQSTGESA